jgi:ankyrin repeat protein
MTRRHCVKLVPLAVLVVIVLYGWHAWRVAAQGQMDQNLMLAIVADDGAAVTASLKTGANPNARAVWPSPSRWRLFVDSLLRRQQAGGWPVLVGAAMHKRHVAIPILLRYGADPNVRDPLGGTALMAIAASSRDVTAARALLESGADPNARDAKGLTALMGAAHAPDTTMVRLLLDHGAAANAAAGDGRTALAPAALCGVTDTVRLLLARGADPNARDRHGFTPLMWAASPGMPDPRQVSSPREGVFIWSESALRPPNPSCVRALLGGGADPTARNSEGKTALDMAGSDTVRRLLRAAQADWLKTHRPRPERDPRR